MTERNTLGISHFSMNESGAMVIPRTKGAHDEMVTVDVSFGLVSGFKGIFGSSTGVVENEWKTFIPQCSPPPLMGLLKQWIGERMAFGSLQDPELEQQTKKLTSLLCVPEKLGFSSTVRQYSDTN